MMGRNQCLALTTAFIVVFGLVGIHRYEEVKGHIYGIKEEVEEPIVGAVGGKAAVRASRATEEVMRVLRAQQAPQVPTAILQRCPLQHCCCKILQKRKMYLNLCLVIRWLLCST